VFDRWWGLFLAGKDVGGKSNWLMDTLIGRPVALIVTAYADSLIWKYKNDFTRI
jgi:hypothetical protein